MLDLATRNLFHCYQLPLLPHIGGLALNKSELVDEIARRADLEKRQAEAALNALVEAVMDATKSGDKVSILGFGNFVPTSRAARTGRNPQTGEPVDIKASKGVRFAPGSAFKTALNG
jgi:DNA-binding protein HU-beta